MITALLVLVLGGASNATFPIVNKSVALSQPTPSALNSHREIASTAPGHSPGHSIHTQRVQAVTLAIQNIEEATRNKRISQMDEKLQGHRSVTQVALCSAICENTRLSKTASTSRKTFQAKYIAKNELLLQKLQSLQLDPLPCTHPAVEALLKCAKPTVNKECDHDVIRGFVRLLDQYLEEFGSSEHPEQSQNHGSL